MFIEDLLASSLNYISDGPLFRVTTVIESFAEYLERVESRSRVLRILWFLSTLVLLIITAGTRALLSWIWNWKVGATFGVAVWSIFFGVTGLLFLSPKTMIATFGGLLGITVNEISTGAGLIAAANREISSIANQIGAVLSPSVQTPDPFVGVLVWLFVILFLLMSLPAFFADDDYAKKASSRQLPAISQQARDETAPKGP